MTTTLRIVILLSFVFLSFSMFQIASGPKEKRKSLVGSASIPWPALLLAKAAVAVSFVSMYWEAAFDPPELPLSAVVLVILLLVSGILLFTPGLFRLGRSLRMGLPDEETTLVTSGIYGFSRNPIYTGMFCLMTASLVYAFSWLNLAAAVTAVLLHHWIVLAEEKFLAARFSDYGAYRKRVRRYI